MSELSFYEPFRYNLLARFVPFIRCEFKFALTDCINFSFQEVRVFCRTYEIKHECVSSTLEKTRRELLYWETIQTCLRTFAKCNLNSRTPKREKRKFCTKLSSKKVSPRFTKPQRHNVNAHVSLSCENLIISWFHRLRFMLYCLKFLTFDGVILSWKGSEWLENLFSRLFLKKFLKIDTRW